MRVFHAAKRDERHTVQQPNQRRGANAIEGSGLPSGRKSAAFCQDAATARRNYSSAVDHCRGSYWGVLMKASDNWLRPWVLSETPG